jgi:hypothetical protein
VGLAVCVGMLVDLAEADDEGAEELQDEFEALSDALRRNGLAEHREPASAEWEPLSFDMFGYSGLHYLRRIAAHLDAGRPLPEPGDTDSSEDALLQGYYDRADRGSGRGLLGRFRRQESTWVDSGPFDHLINHSDAEGYYVPQRFDRVIHASKVPGELVGSSYRLRDELLVLRDALEIPSGLDPEADDLWKAADTQGEGDLTWQRYGVESFTCVRLLAAADASIERGAAIVFA